MNPNYTYPRIELWSDEPWAGRVSPIADLAAWIGAHEPDALAPVDDSIYKDKGTEACYSNKTYSMDVPELIEYWDARGIHYECREMGGTRWVSMVPCASYEDRETRIPAIVVLHQEDYNDVYWAMHTVQHYAALNAAAAKEGFAVLYVTASSPDMPYLYTGVLNESCDLFPLDTKRIYLDLTTLRAAGATLRQAGLDMDESAVEAFSALAVPALNISRIWQSPGDSWMWMLSNCSADFDAERMIRSEQGARIAEGEAVSYDFTGPDDPALKAFFNQMGVDCACHDYHGHRWASAVPTYIEPGKKLPVMLIFQEVNYASDYYVLNAYSQYFEYVRLAAQGELIAVFFARESPENNDLLADIAKEAMALYPIDSARVYVTGHSHNGHFTAEFMRRHPDLVTAVAPMGDQPGVPHPSDCKEPVPVTDEMVEIMRDCDIPLALISGMCEMGCMFPVGKTADNVKPGMFCQQTDVEGRIRSWQRRLYAHRIPMASAEEIRRSVTEGDYVTRKLGIPGGRKSMVTLCGFEHYIADFDNENGDWRLRIIAVENMPHMPVPSKELLAWDFVRRFARDENGKIIQIK